MQIATILAVKEKKISIAFPAVQIQRGGSDCGLYALAFATSLCEGENPSRISYIQHELRDHLFDCLESGVISTFPQRRRKKTCMLNRMCFDVFCFCRLPASGRMICCNSCGEWYHEDCVTVPQAIWENRSSKWLCNIHS